MTTEELARMLREIDVKEFTEPDLYDFDEIYHESYDEIPDYLREMYLEWAETYQKYFDIERKVE